jgi:hypothetical protein
MRLGRIKRAARQAGKRAPRYQRRWRPRRVTVPRAALNELCLAELDACRRAANYLTVGQIYLQDTRCCAIR